jgi:hypothetical protein
VKTRFAIVCFVLLLVGAAHAQDSGRKFKVMLSVSATSPLKEDIESVMSRELRLLGDVELVTDYPEWEIEVVGIDVYNKDGELVGVAVSTAVLWVFDNSLWTPAIQSYYSTQAIDLTSTFQLLTANLYGVDAHWLRIAGTGPDELRTMCQQLIDDFDQKQLQPSRDYNSGTTTDGK